MIKTTLITIANLIFVMALNAQSAKVQFINNSADKELNPIDIYLNDKMFVDDLAFRSATTFKDIEGGRSISLKVGLGDTHCSNCTKYELKVELENNKTYIIVANGMMDNDGYNPAQPFELDVYAKAKEAGNSSNKTSVLVHHGSSDAPSVDINNVTEQPSSVLVNDIAYKGFSEYLDLPVKDYKISVSTADGNTVVKTYDAPLAKLGLGGAAVTVIASGFLDSSKNSNGAPFGLWVASAKGGALIQLPESKLSTDSFSNYSASIYPNPASSSFFISTKNFKNTKVKVFNILGKTIREFDLNTKLTTVNVSDLAPNFYIVKLYKDDSAVKALKLMIK